MALDPNINTREFQKFEEYDGVTTVRTKAFSTGQYSSTLPTLSDGDFGAIQVDSKGRIIVSNDITDQPPSFSLVSRKVIAANTSNVVTSTLASDVAIKQFYVGGRAACDATLAIYTAATTEFVPGGDFESTANVAQWTNTGIGDGALIVPAYSTVQAHTGTGSVKLGPSAKSDANNYPEITHTFSPAKDMSVWRYVLASFYNEPPAGGAVTRTIQIRLTSGTAIRSYAVSGLTSAAPFNAAGWIDIVGEISAPTSTAGTGEFDVNSVNSISLRMSDSGNKAFTAIYWDTVQLSGSLDIISKIYSPGQTTSLEFDPVILKSAGQVIYLKTRNNGTTSAEFQTYVSGVNP